MNDFRGEIPDPAGSFRGERLKQHWSRIIYCTMSSFLFFPVPIALPLVRGGRFVDVGHISGIKWIRSFFLCMFNL